MSQPAVNHTSAYAQYSLGHGELFWCYSAVIPAFSLAVMWVIGDDVIVNLVLSLLGLLGFLLLVVQNNSARHVQLFLIFNRGQWWIGSSLDRAEPIYPGRGMLRFSHFLYIPLVSRKGRTKSVFVWRDVVGMQALRRLSRQLAEYEFRNSDS